MIDSGAPAQETAKWDGDRGGRAAGAFTANGVGGAAAFESLHQGGAPQGGRVCDEQVHVVGFAVELSQLRIELGADRAHEVLAEGEDLAGERRPPVFGRTPGARAAPTRCAGRGDFGESLV